MEETELLIEEFEKENDKILSEQKEEISRPDFYFGLQKEEFEEAQSAKIKKSVFFNTQNFFGNDKESKLKKLEFEDLDDKKLRSSDDFSGEKYREKFHWKPAIIQSGIFLGIQHGFRLMQKKTVREFDGPFFRDWGNSIKNLRGWSDGDSMLINGIAHPLQGGVTGRIFINNSDNAKRQEFSKSKAYWESRFRTFVWSTVWSTQFEMGPFSEATIGNVGLQEKNGHSTMAWVDLVITPVIGTGVVVGEDMIDKYVLKNWLERKKGGRVSPKIKILRSILTPTTSFTNILRGKYPWYRDFR